MNTWIFWIFQRRLLLVYSPKCYPANNIKLVQYTFIELVSLINWIKTLNELCSKGAMNILARKIRYSIVYVHGGQVERQWSYISCSSHGYFQSCFVFSFKHNISINSSSQSSKFNSNEHPNSIQTSMLSPQIMTVGKQ